MRNAAFRPQLVSNSILVLVGVIFLLLLSFLISSQ